MSSEHSVRISRLTLHPPNDTIPVTQGDQPSSRIVLTPTTQAKHATSTPSAMALWRRVRVKISAAVLRL
jgi:hypothetical protein